MTTEEKKKERFTLLSLNGDDEREFAYLIALHARGGAYKVVGAMLGDSPRMFELAAGALRGKFRPRPIRAKIIKAYVAAGRTGNGINIDALPPTLREVKEQFVRLFVKEPHPAVITSRYLEDLEGRKEIPKDFSFRSMLDRLHLPWRQDKRGPRGP
jgi:hypothetical protein